MPRGHVIPDGGRIAALRGEADLTQRELAEGAGYGLRTISKIESGQPTAARTLAAIATVLSRRTRRSIAVRDLLEGPGVHAPANDTSALCVEEVLKVLDLSRCRCTKNCGCAGEGVLFEQYQFASLPARPPILTFHYATTGRSIQGACLSHPRDHEWLDVTDRLTGAASCPGVNACYQLRVQLSGTEHGSARVQNRLVYVDGFIQPESDWFYTHVVYPTDCLTMLLRFPESRPCLAVHGSTRQHPAEPFTRVPAGPSRVPDGVLVYWRIAAPPQGASYQVEWTW